MQILTVIKLSMTSLASVLRFHVSKTKIKNMLFYQDAKKSKSFLQMHIAWFKAIL